MIAFYLTITIWILVGLLTWFLANRGSEYLDVIDFFALPWICLLGPVGLLRWIYVIHGDKKFKNPFYKP